MNGRIRQIRKGNTGKVGNRWAVHLAEMLTSNKLFYRSVARVI